MKNESRLSIEMKPGETREFNGVEYEAVECGPSYCSGDCELLRPHCWKIWEVMGECGAPFRSDATNIVFHEVGEKEIEK